MMNIPANLFYTKDHEWLLFEGDVVTMGVTEHAQDQLGDIVFVELPDVDESVVIGDSLGVVESTKAVSDVFSPVTGTVIETNEIALESPILDWN